MFSYVNVKLPIIKKLAMHIRGLALFSIVFLVHLTTFRVQSIFLYNFDRWKSDRICKNIEGTELPLYNVGIFCQLAVSNSSGGSCEGVQVQLQSIVPDNDITTRDVQLAVCVINDQKSKCLALGLNDDRSIVFDYGDGKCQGGIIKTFQSELDLL